MRNIGLRTFSSACRVRDSRVLVLWFDGECWSPRPLEASTCAMTMASFPFDDIVINPTIVDKK